MRLCASRLAFLTLPLLFVAHPAAAHVRLTSPTPRYAETRDADADIKEGPCGRTNDSRTADSSRTTTFRPGETIKVQFKETINHDGHFRIAFDADGQDDLASPTDFDDIQTNPELPVLLDGIEDKNGGDYEVQVTLPNVECTNCTLQLIQVMYGGTFDPGPDASIYFTCADIILEGEPVGGGGATNSGGSSGSTSSGGSSNATGGTSSTGGVLSTGGSTSGGSSSKGGTTGVAGSSTAGSGTGARRGVTQPADETGCTCSVPSTSASSLLAKLGAAATLLAICLRRRH